jgi:membrane protease YdiL (CAAX protease family)
MNDKTSRKIGRVLAGSLILLLTSYAIYFIRYPIWSWSVEPIFLVLILSYLMVLVVALVLLKKDLHKSLSSVFRFHGLRLILIALGLGLLLQAVWYTLALSTGSNVTFLSFPFLHGYDAYSYYSFPVAFASYFVFVLIGAFAEEVAYRGYVKSRVSLRYGVVAGISVSTLFFSLQHIHVFQATWLADFFQGQFISVMAGGVCTGYLFHKSKGDIWSVFTFHAVNSIFSILLPIQITYNVPWAFGISTVAAYAILILVLRFLPSSTFVYR